LQPSKKGYQTPCYFCSSNKGLGVVSIKYKFLIEIPILRTVIILLQEKGAQFVQGG
jgi:hypothetical protein